MPRVEFHNVSKSYPGGIRAVIDLDLTVEDGEAYIRQMHIPPYEQGNRWNEDPIRRRKLLMHRREIDRMAEAVEQKGQTLVPLKLYFSKGRAKVLIGIAKGRKQYDKRHAMADRDAQREIARARREAERGR